MIAATRIDVENTKTSAIVQVSFANQGFATFDVDYPVRTLDEVNELLTDKYECVVESSQIFTVEIENE